MGEPLLRDGMIKALVLLLTRHEQEEQRLLALLRAHGSVREVEWRVHDQYERWILETMAEATDAEIRHAIDVYDALPTELPT